MVDEASVIEDLEKEMQALDKENGQLGQLVAEVPQLESQYRKVFELSGAPTMIIDADMPRIMVNREFVKLTGYTQTEIEGRMKWTAFIAEEDIDRMKGYHVGRRDAHPDIPNEYECRVVDRSGRSKDIFVKVGMLDETRQVARRARPRKGPRHAEQCDAFTGKHIVR